MHVSKLAKGIAAGGLGLALLIGGGTFALWSDSAEVDAGSINSGTLTVTAGAPSWSNVSDPDAPVAIPQQDLADYHIVPGDVLQMTTDLTITAVGNNLHAELSADLASMTSEDDPANLLGVLADNTDLAVSGLTETGTNVFTVTGDQGTDGVQTVTATLTITFPADDETVSGTFGQGESVDLSALTFDLDQVAA